MEMSTHLGIRTVRWPSHLHNASIRTLASPHWQPSQRKSSRLHESGAHRLAQQAPAVTVGQIRQMWYFQKL